MKQKIAFLLLILFLAACSTTTSRVTERLPANSVETGEVEKEMDGRLSCGPHPFNPIKNNIRKMNVEVNGKSVNVDVEVPNVFNDVKSGEHGFMVTRTFTLEDDGADRYFANAIHFSAGLPRHMFSALLQFELDKEEFDALNKAIDAQMEIEKESILEHNSTYNNSKGKFTPFIVLSRLPKRTKNGVSPGTPLQRHWCMKDLNHILSGHKTKIYGGENKMYGTIMMWNPNIRGVFKQYENLGNSESVIVFDLPDTIVDLSSERNFMNGPFVKSKKFGEITRVFFDPHRPISNGVLGQNEFINEDDKARYWLRDEQSLSQDHAELIRTKVK